MSERFTPYQRRLFILLSVATFFEGYDLMALAQLLPEIRETFGLDELGGGILVGVINAGTVVAYLLVRQADRWGRRRTLTVTIAGYTIFTGLSGLAPDVYFFAVAQFVARIFLIAEWAISMVIAAEEFPAARRGMVIGVIQAFSSFGSIACAGVVPLLLRTEWEWRTVYFVGVLPLVILAFARRNLRETRRFEAQVSLKPGLRRGLLHILRTPYRKRVLQLGLIWFLTYLCTQNGVTFFKEYATAEGGLNDDQVGLAITIAAVVSMPMVLYSGRLLDVVGRRHGAAIIFGLGAAGVFFSFTLHGMVPLTCALVFGIFGASGVLPVLNAYNTELFPTDQRGDAFAWSNNLLGRIGYVLSPAFVGLAAREIGAWGPVMQVSTIFPLLALGLIYALLPETRARELEDTAKL